MLIYLWGTIVQTAYAKYNTNTQRPNWELNGEWFHVPLHFINSQLATEATQRNNILQNKLVGNRNGFYVSVYLKITTLSAWRLFCKEHRLKIEEKKKASILYSSVQPKLTCALTLSCNRDMGTLLCFITTRYGSFCTVSISSWNFCRDDCLITRVFAKMKMM